MLNAMFIVNGNLVGIWVVRGWSKGTVLSPMVRDTVGLVRVGNGTSYSMLEISLQ